MSEKKISLGLMTIYDTEIKSLINTKDAEILKNSKEYAKGLFDTVSNGAISENTTAISNLSQEVATNKTASENADKSLGERLDVTESDIGDLEKLATSNKTDLVAAINEVRNSVSAGGTAAAITITTSTTTSGALKSYTVKQGDNTIGVIDIPKDMVVTSGEVVVNPSGQTAGTYIKLVLANVTDPLYINVGALVDIYKAKANAAQIQISVDSNTREISATIVAGSIGTTELAADSVTTVKIADANVTLAKLSTSVQASLGKADSAVQKITEGSTNGKIKVDGTEVAVHGLGSAAFTESSVYTNAINSNTTLINGHETRIAAIENADEWATEAEILAMFGK